MISKNIVWLASYPKSGNTWMRAFLLNYITDAKEPVPINQIARLSFGDSVAALYQKVGGRPTTSMSEEQILALRPKVLRAIAGNGADMNFVKTHNANTSAFGHRLISPDVSRLAIYVLRNPLDVALSYATHYGQSIDKAITSIAHPDNTTLGDAKNVKQFLGSWSAHVTGWARVKQLPVHVMRYEDMEREPVKTFASLVKRLGLPEDGDRLDRAIAHSSFKELQRQEAASGFIEQSQNSDRFFDKGRSDRWKEELTDAQVARIREDHGKVMQKYGYF